MTQSYQKYQVTEIKTSDPVRIVVLLYEGAIKNLNQTIRLWKSDNAAAASAKLLKTQEIIRYLSSTLDFEKGGEISQNLARLYDYMRDQLNEANINKDEALTEGVIALLQTLLDGWQGIAGQQAEANANANAEPAQTVQAAAPSEHIAPPAQPQPARTPASRGYGNAAAAAKRPAPSPLDTEANSKISFVVG